MRRSKPKVPKQKAEPRKRRVNVYLYLLLKAIIRYNAERSGYPTDDPGIYNFMYHFYCNPEKKATTTFRSPAAERHEAAYGKVESLKTNVWQEKEYKFTDEMLDRLVRDFTPFESWKNFCLVFNNDLGTFLEEVEPGEDYIPDEGQIFSVKKRVYERMATFMKSKLFDDEELWFNVLPDLTLQSRLNIISIVDEIVLYRTDLMPESHGKFIQLSPQEYVDRYNIEKPIHDLLVDKNPLSTFIARVTSCQLRFQILPISEKYVEKLQHGIFSTVSVEDVLAPDEVDGTTSFLWYGCSAGYSLSTILDKATICRIFKGYYPRIFDVHDFTKVPGKLKIFYIEGRSLELDPHINSLGFERVQDVLEIDTEFDRILYVTTLDKIFDILYDYRTVLLNSPPVIITSKPVYD